MNSWQESLTRMVEGSHYSNLSWTLCRIQDPKYSLSPLSSQPGFPVLENCPFESGLGWPNHGRWVSYHEQIAKNPKPLLYRHGSNQLWAWFPNLDSLSAEQCDFATGSSFPLKATSDMSLIQFAVRIVQWVTSNGSCYLRPPPSANPRKPGCALPGGHRWQNVQ